MTVASTTSKSGVYNGNGVTTNFAVLFKYFAKADVDVIVTSSAGVETTKTLDTHYTLTVPGDTGTVSFITTPTDFRPQTGETVTIVRTMAMIQDMDLTSGGGLSASTVEANADTQLMQIQEIAERVSRAPLLRQTSAAAPITLPQPVADNLIAWNSAGTDLENKVPADLDIGLVSPFIQTLLDDLTAAAARTTLDAQQLDSDLTAIAALTTTAIGRSLLAAVDAPAIAEIVGVGVTDSPTIVNLTQTGYHDLTEISEPATPSANISRAYARDVNGVTHRFAKDASGRNRILTPTIADVLEFGALGDGTTDDTAEIAAAITQAGTGSALFFPEGVYIFSDHDTDGTGLTQLSGQKWFGAGRGATILRLAAATTDIDVLIDASDFAEDYSIEDMQIDGNRANITPGTDLYNTFYMIRGPRGGKRGAYRNLHLANSWGRSLQTSDESQTEIAEDILVEGVWVTNAGTKAISATRSKRVTIKGCFVEVDPYTAADHVDVIDDGNARSGSCFECNESTDVTICGNHGIQIGASITAPGIRFVNQCERIRAFGNTIEGAEYLGFIQNANDVDFFGNIGLDIQGDAIIIADADGETGTCKRVRVHHNTVNDTDGAYVVITANKTTPNPEVECYIYENDFIQTSGSPTHGIYNNGVIAPASGGSCVVHQWGNIFTGTIPNQLAGPAAAQIRPEPESGWKILQQSSVASAVTGTLTETALATITVPANRMGANGRLRITAHWSFTSSGNNKIQRVRFAGTQLYASTQTTTAQQKVISEIGNRNSLSSQVTGVGGTVDGLGAGTALVTTAFDTSSDRNITLTGQLANTGETITLESYVVELFYQI